MTLLFKSHQFKTSAGLVGLQGRVAEYFFVNPVALLFSSPTFVPLLKSNTRGQKSCPALLLVVVTVLPEDWHIVLV